jgi:hypothetical protein
MLKESLMLITLGFSTIHKIVYNLCDKDADGNVIGEIGFWLNEVKLKYDTWIWFLFEHINILIYILIMILPGPIRRVPGIMFLLIHVVDLLSFIIIYDDIFKRMPLTWNVLKIVIFGLVLINENINGQSRCF